MPPVLCILQFLVQWGQARPFPLGWGGSSLGGLARGRRNSRYPLLHHLQERRSSHRFSFCTMSNTPVHPMCSMPHRSGRQICMQQNLRPPMSMSTKAMCTPFVQSCSRIRRMNWRRRHSPPDCGCTANSHEKMRSCEAQRQNTGKSGCCRSRLLHERC
jgi:hypothetical protein